MFFLTYFTLGFLIPLANFHSLIKRSDVSYGSPDYKFCECGRKNGMMTPDDGRILGGKEASPNEYPWMALIVAVAVNSTFPQLICGGSLISDQYVLSAAHCLRPKYTQDQIKVVLGEHNYCRTDIRTVTFSVEAFIQHPEYVDSKHLFRDVMLIKLNMRVTFNAYIRPICLPNRVPWQSAEERHGGKMGDILGWGVGDTLNESCTLRKTSLFVYRPQNCPYKAFHLFCAGYREEPRDSCVGDSGGPFQILNKENKYELIGILSSGVACGDVDSPSLYTDVLYVLPWIYEVSRNSMFCWR